MRNMQKTNYLSQMDRFGFVKYLLVTTIVPLSKENFILLSVRKLYSIGHQAFQWSS